MFNFFKKRTVDKNDDEVYNSAIAKLSNYLKDLKKNINDESILVNFLKEVETRFQTQNEEFYPYYTDQMMMVDKWDFLASKLLELHRNSPTMSYPLYCELIPIYAFRLRYSNPLESLDKLPERASISMDFTAKILDVLCSSKGDYFIPNLVFKEVEDEITKKKNQILEKKKMLVNNDSYGYEDSSKWDLERRLLAGKILDNLTLDLREHANSESLREIYVEVY